MAVTSLLWCVFAPQSAGVALWLCSSKQQACPGTCQKALTSPSFPAIQLTARHHIPSVSNHSGIGCFSSSRANKLAHSSTVKH